MNDLIILYVMVPAGAETFVSGTDADNPGLGCGGVSIEYGSSTGPYLDSFGVVGNTTDSGNDPDVFLVSLRARFGKPFHPPCRFDLLRITHTIPTVVKNAMMTISNITPRVKSRSCSSVSESFIDSSNAWLKLKLFEPSSQRPVASPRMSAVTLTQTKEGSVLTSVVGTFILFTIATTMSNAETEVCIAK